MEDAEALSEKKLQEIAKEEEAKKRKEQFNFERFRKNPKDEVKPEAKKIPKRPGEKQAEKESEKETEKSASKAPIVLRSRSPTRQPEDSRADSAQASTGKWKVTAGAKRFLTRAVLEAAKDVGRRAKKLKPTQEEKEKEKEKEKKKSPSPKPREHSHGGGVSSNSNLDFLGSLASPVDTIVWATVDCARTWT